MITNPRQPVSRRFPVLRGPEPGKAVAHFPLPPSALLEGNLKGFGLGGFFREDRRQELARFVLKGNDITGPVSPSENREMKGIISLVLILGTIGSLQHFDLIWVMTEGGPARATTTFSIEVYRNAFKYYNMGFAAVVGTVWAILLGCFSFVYLRRVQEGGE